MEQRIGSSSQPLEGAGFDPAFIPGLTAPVSGQQEESGPGKDRSGEPEETNGTVTSGSSAPEPRDVVPGPDEAAQDGAQEDESVPDGPVFEASDRRASIVADHRGVRLRLDDQECEFRWDEIGAVETETARFGKRYTVTVHTPDRRWYPIEIDAPARSRFAEWDTELDAVLDAYFDDGEDAEAEAQVEGDAETDADDSESSDESGADESGAEASGPDLTKDSAGSADSKNSEASKGSEEPKGSKGSK
ncbi:hypothetical protein ACS0VI_07515 [Streptomyces sp. H28]|uniref:hypothetical protein n=1 Tax=Streptomyces sp. H28 TaxID=2775865 RepID=UPI00298C1C79|nr:hypothetical protein [Streptomyces sp. H28]